MFNLQNHLGELAENLGSQIETHQNLLDLITMENMLEASCSLEELESTQQSKGASLQKATRLESERLQLTSQIIDAEQLPEDAKLEVMAEQADPSLKERLLTAKETLTRIILDIQNIARDNANKAMIRANCIKEVQESAHKKFKRVSLYGKNGRMSNPQGSILMNKSI